MKGDAEIIEILNEVLCAELTGINQYFIHSEMCENWRYDRLAQHSRKEAVEEMKHARR
jgi:bacterioferritin